MRLKNLFTTVIITAALAGCADPAIWSAVAPGHEGGIVTSRMLINVTEMPDPQRQWSEQALVEEVAKLGVAPVRIRALKKDIVWDETPARATAPTSDPILTMTLISERMRRVDVPLTYHPGETVVTTYERKGKTITEIKEKPGYTTGGYSYDVPVAKANFALTRQMPTPGGNTITDTVWTALAEVEGGTRTGWAALSEDMARRAVRRLGQDKVLIVPEAEPARVAQR